MARLMPKNGAIAVCGHNAFVTNSFSDTFSMIDMREDRLVATHPTGKGPVNATFSPDWKTVFIANGFSGSITTVDAATGEVIGTLPAGGAHPSGMRFLPDGRHLVISYVGDTVTTPGNLALMDLTTGKLLWKIPMAGRSERFDITPDGKRAYVANLIGQTIAVVDLEKGAVTETIASPERYPFNVLISPKGTRVYIGATMSNTIVEIDTATNKVIKTITTAAGPNGMAFTPDGQNIFITSVYGGRLQAYNVSSGVVSDGSFVGFMPGFIRLTNDGKKGLISRPYGQVVSVIDGTTMQITANIETGLGPSTVAICGNP